MRKNLFSWQKSLCRKRGKNPYLVGALMLLLGTASAQSLNQSAYLSEPYRMPQINFAGMQFTTDGIMEPEEGTCDLVGELENPSSGVPTWNRVDANGNPVPVWGAGNGVPYHVYGPFTVSETGNYTLNNAQTAYDGFLLLYHTSFDPEDGTVNFVAGNDDGGSGSQITTELEVGTEYFMVTTSYSFTQFGSFENTITGSGDVSCGIVTEGCLEAPAGAYPSNIVYVSCYGVPTVATYYGSTSDFSLIGLSEGITYNFTSSYETDFITIGNQAGTEVLTTGTGAVTWTAPADMVVRFYTHADADCGTDANFNHVRTVDCGGEPVTFEEPDFDCFQGDGSISALEQGQGVNPEGVYRVADDFIVEAGTEFSLQQITVNVLSTTAVTSGTFNIRESNGSAPGGVIETITMIPNTSEVFGNALGLDFYRLEFNLATPIEFTEGTYWLDPTFTNADNSTVYWEVTYTGSNGSMVYFSHNLGSTWSPDVYDESQAIFYVAGECNTVGEEEGDDCDITYAGSLEGEGLGGLNIFKWASDFSIAPNSSMTVERVKFNVYSNVSTVDVSFHEDNAGVPGVEIVAPMTIVPTSQTLIGTSVIGTNIYELVLDLPTAQNFEGGGSGTNYWMAIKTVTGSEALNNFWESADELNNETNIYYSLFGNTWSNAANAGYPGDGAFILEGTCIGGEPEPADNDDCEGAIPVSCGETVTGTTADATDSGFNPSPDRFYSFTGDGTVQNVTISLCDSAFDTYLRVFSDCSLTNEIAFNDDACGSRSRLTFESDGTSTYIIMVEGRELSSGAYTLSVNCATPLGEPDYPCFQGDGLFSNGFEDAYNVSSASDTFRNADDFVVEDNNTFTMQYLRLNLMTIRGDIITSAEFNIRADEGGVPSETNIIDTFTAIPTSQTFIGTNFGYDISEVEFVLDEDRPELPAGTYWLEPVVTAGLGLAWWEVTSTGSSGDVVHTSEHLGPWSPDPANRQAVFFVAGECTELGVSDMNSFDFTYHPNPVKDVLNISSKKLIENVSVFNLAGQKVLNHAKVSNNQVDVSALTSGTYVFKVTLEGGQIETFKIIKK